MSKLTRPSVLLILLALSPAAAFAQTPVVPVPMPEGLVVLEATSERLSAIYASPYAEISLDMQVAGGLVHSSVRDSLGQIATKFTVPLLEGPGLVEKYLELVPEVVDAMLAESPTAKERFSEPSFETVWTYVQMSEELSLRLSGSEVPASMLAATRLHANSLGRAYETVSAQELETDAKAPEKGAPEKRIGIFNGNNNCNGACGPGCDWCLRVPFTNNTYACATNLFCVLHDAYCGAWWDFFDCDFGNCNFG